MSDPVWRDESSFSRNDKDRMPNTFVAWFGPIRATVHHHKDHHPHHWFLTAPPFVTQYRLVSEEPDGVAAKRQALGILRMQFHDALDAVKKAQAATKPPKKGKKP